MKKSMIIICILLGLGASNSVFAVSTDINDIWKKETPVKKQNILRDSPEYDAIMRYKEYVNDEDLFDGNNGYRNYPYYNNNYYNGNYNNGYYNNNYYNYNYQYPTSEFYKSFENLDDGVIINITTDNQNIVAKIQQTIQQSIQDEFAGQPLNIQTRDLYNGAQCIIRIGYGSNYGNYYSQDGYYGNYGNIDGYSFLSRLQNFARNTMPEINYDGTVFNWK